MKNEFIKTLNAIAYDKRPSEVMCDWLQMAKVSLANAFYQDPKLEELYLEIAGKYSKEQMELLCKLLSIATSALEENPKQDFLGEIYMEVVFGNKKSGQFFTPYHVAESMVRVAIDFGVIEENGYMTVEEPACGSGVMGIALRNYLGENGYGTNSCVMRATDIDKNCCAMAYIQLSLLGMPALVIHGNSLTEEVWESLYSVPYFLSNFPQIFAVRDAIAKFQELLEAETEPPEAEQPKADASRQTRSFKKIEEKQLSLFE